MGAARSSLTRPLPADRGQHPTRLPRAAPEDDAFASLYRAHAPGVYAAAHGVLGRASDAEDVTQEVFVRFWSDPGRFDPARGKLGGYLRLMARSRALDLWRHEQAVGRARDRLKVASREEDDRRGERPDAVAEREEGRRELRAALRRLPRAQREALILSYWGALTPHQIARRAGVPFGTARSRMRLGLEKLRREWTTNPPEAAGER